MYAIITSKCLSYDLSRENILRSSFHYFFFLHLLFLSYMRTNFAIKNLFIFFPHFRYFFFFLSRLLNMNVTSFFILPSWQCVRPSSSNETRRASLFKYFHFQSNDYHYVNSVIFCYRRTLFSFLEISNGIFLIHTFFFVDYNNFRSIYFSWKKIFFFYFFNGKYVGCLLFGNICVHHTKRHYWCLLLDMLPNLVTWTHFLLVKDLAI